MYMTSWRRNLMGLFVLLGAQALMATPSLGDPARVGRFKQLRAGAQQALESLAPRGGQPLTVRWSSARPTPVVVRGLAIASPGQTSEQRARAFLRLHPRLFAAAVPQLRHVETRSSRGIDAVRFQQHHMGLPVEGASLVVALDNGGRVRSLRSSLVAVNLSTTRPVLRARRAMAIAARQAAGAAAAAVGGEATLVITAGGRPHLAYAVLLPFSVDPRGRRHLVDAVDGAYLGWRRGVLVDGHARGKGVRR